ncbi:MAG: hypothetical protein NVS2B4_11810 [Ramlibacter sp.]
MMIAAGLSQTMEGASRQDRALKFARTAVIRGACATPNRQPRTGRTLSNVKGFNMNSMRIVRVFQGIRADSLGVAYQLTAAAVIGLIVLYGVAFAESPLLHNAAHDVRHVTVKPCH